MTLLEQRLRRCEYARLRRMAADAGAPYGVSADRILAAMRRFYALPDAEQRAMFADFYATLTAQEARDLDAIRRRHANILLTA
jgi:hypothetical protein